MSQRVYKAGDIVELPAGTGTGEIVERQGGGGPRNALGWAPDSGLVKHDMLVSLWYGG